MFVDNDRVQCPHAEFQSIQAAVAAAPPESKIMVCPGLYPERVVVPKPLELEGHQKPQDAHNEHDCLEASVSDPTREAIVDGFHLEANDILLEGFVVRSVSTNFGGAFSGFRIRHNVVQDNFFGIILSTSGALESRVDHNCVRRNFFGVVVTRGGNARLDHNALNRNFHGIRLLGSTQPLTQPRELEISHNHSLLDGSFFVTNHARDVQVVYNEASLNHQFGSIASFGGSTRHVVEHNKLRQAPNGIAFPFAIGTPNADWTIRCNDIREMVRPVFPGAQNGIHASFNTLDDSLIAYNKLNENGQDGINLQTGNTANEVEHNEADRNGSDGIHAQGATGNVFLKNRMFDNAEHDAHDDARAANRWIDNHCRTDFPPGRSASGRATRVPRRDQPKEDE